jgi:hypothetical protein
MRATTRFPNVRGQRALRLADRAVDRMAAASEADARGGGMGEREIAIGRQGDRRHGALDAGPLRL